MRFFKNKFHIAVLAIFISLIHVSTASAVGALVIQISAKGGVSSATTTLDTSTGDLLVVYIPHYYVNTANLVLTDSRSGCASPCNTWTQKNVYGNGNTGSTLFYAWGTGIHVGTSHTFLLSGSSTFSSIFVLVFSGSKTSADPFVDQSGGSNANTTTCQWAASKGSSGQIAVASVSNDTSGVTFTKPTGYTSAGTLHLDYEAGDGNASGGQVAYLILSAATQPTWTLSASHANACAGAVFDVAAGGGGGTVTPKLGIIGVGDQ
jgi:hypothetical protein